MSHPPYFANAEVLMIDVDQVDPDLPGRIGLFYPAKAEALAVLIAAHGQNDPIKVVKRGNAAKTDWKLVAGLHRLEACRIAGVEVAAIEVLPGNALSKFDANNLRDIQASENMDRRELAPLERAMFVHAVADAAKARAFAKYGVDNDKALAAKAKAHNIRFSDVQDADNQAFSAGDNLSSAYGWSEETAEACGLGPRDLQRSLRIFRCIIAPNRDLIDAFKDHPVAKTANDLLDICKLKDNVIRRRVIEALIAGPADLGFVLQMLGIKSASTAPVGQEKFATHFVANWHRLSLPNQRLQLPVFVNQLTPGLKAALRELLDGEGA